MFPHCTSILFTYFSFQEHILFICEKHEKVSVKPCNVPLDTVKYDSKFLKIIYIL